MNTAASRSCLKNLSSKATFSSVSRYSRRMSSKATTHLERTHDASRSKILSNALVVNVNQESPTVKTLRLNVVNKHFSFKAGQWVDFIVPSLATVGGFSMCSSPSLLNESRMLDLAVKVSSHPPADWVCNKCKVGDEVFLKVGGDCIWDPESMKHKNTLLIAGGIGINPIFSILQDIEDSRRVSGDQNSYGKTMLLYSSSTEDELIFKEKLDSVSNKNENVNCVYHITKGNQISKENGIEGRRIDYKDVYSAVNKLKNENGLNCFLCGPPPMIKSIQHYLVDSGVQKADIHFEQWW